MPAAVPKGYRPKDALLAANWQELLQSVGLEKFASQPLLQPATQSKLTQQQEVNRRVVNCGKL